MARRKPTEPDTSALLDVSPRQAAAADLVAVGKTDQDVADAVGVTRQTVNVWRNHHPAFAVAVEERRREFWAVCRDGVLAMMPRAVKAVSDGLDGPDAWRVGLALLKLSGIAEQRALRPTGPQDVRAFITTRARDHRNRTLFSDEPEFYQDVARADCVMRLTAVENGEQRSDSTTIEGSEVLP